MADDLTLKQSLFVEAYIGEAAGNGRKAAAMAGYAGDAHTLEQVASENLKKTAIATNPRTGRCSP